MEGNSNPVDKYGLSASFTFELAGDAFASMKSVRSELQSLEDSVRKTASTIDRSGIADQFKSASRQANAASQGFSKTFGNGVNQVAQFKRALDPIKSEFRTLKAEAKNIDFGDLFDTDQVKEARQEINRYIQSLEKLERQVTGNSNAERELSANIKYQKRAAASRIEAVELERQAMKAAQRQGSAQAINDVASRAIAKPMQLGRSSIELIKGFDDQMSAIKAVSDPAKLGKKEMKELREEAKRLGATTAFSAKDAAEAMVMLAQAGYDANQVMDATGATLKLASAGSLGLAEATDITTASLGAFQADAKDAAHFADVLANSANEAQMGVTDIGEAMKYVGPPAKAFGASIEQASALIGVLSNAGIKGSNAGTALRSAFLRLAAPPKPAEGAMAQLGLKTLDSKTGGMRDVNEILQEISDKTSKLGAGKRISIIKDLFGTEATPAMLYLVNNIGKVKELTQMNVDSSKVENGLGAAGKAARDMENNIGGAFRNFESAIEGVQIEIGEVLKPVVISVINTISNFLGVLIALPQPVKTLIVAIGSLAVGLAAVASAASGIGIIFFGMQQSMATAGLAMLTLKNGLVPLTGFMDVALKAFAGGNPLIGTLNLLKDYSKMLPAPMLQLAASIQAVGAASMAFLVSPLGLATVALVGLYAALEVFTPDVNVLGVALGTLVAPLGFILGFLKGFVTGLASALAPLIKFGDAVSNQIAAPLRSLQETLSTIAQSFVSFSNQGQSAGEAIGKAFGDSIVGPISAAANSIKVLWGGAIGYIVNLLKPFADFAKFIGKRLVAGLAQNSPGPTVQIPNRWEKAIEKVKRFLRELLNTAIAIGIGLVGAMTQGLGWLENWAQLTGSSIESAWSNTVAHIQLKTQALSESMRPTWEGMKEGFLGVFSVVKSAVLSAGSLVGAMLIHFTRASLVSAATARVLSRYKAPLDGTKGAYFSVQKISNRVGARLVADALVMPFEDGAWQFKIARILTNVFSGLSEFIEDLLRNKFSLPAPQFFKSFLAPWLRKIIKAPFADGLKQMFGSLPEELMTNTRDVVMRGLKKIPFYEAVAQLFSNLRSQIFNQLLKISPALAQGFETILSSLKLPTSLLGTWAKVKDFLTLILPKIRALEAFIPQLASSLGMAALNFARLSGMNMGWIAALTPFFAGFASAIAPVIWWVGAVMVVLDLLKKLDMAAKALVTTFDFLINASNQLIQLLRFGLGELVGFVSGAAVNSVSKIVQVVHGLFQGQTANSGLKDSLDQLTQGSSMAGISSAIAGTTNNIVNLSEQAQAAGIVMASAMSDGINPMSEAWDNFRASATEALDSVRINATMTWLNMTWGFTDAQNKMYAYGLRTWYGLQNTFEDVSYRIGLYWQDLQARFGNGEGMSALAEQAVQVWQTIKSTFSNPDAIAQSAQSAVSGAAEGIQNSLGGLYDATIGKVIFNLSVAFEMFAIKLNLVNTGLLILATFISGSLRGDIPAIVASLIQIAPALAPLGPMISLFAGALLRVLPFITALGINMGMLEFKPHFFDAFYDFFWQIQEEYQALLTVLAAGWMAINFTPLAGGIIKAIGPALEMLGGLINYVIEGIKAAGGIFPFIGREIAKGYATILKLLDGPMPDFLAPFKPFLKFIKTVMSLAQSLIRWLGSIPLVQSISQNFVKAANFIKAKAAPILEAAFEFYLKEVQPRIMPWIDWAVKNLQSLFQGLTGIINNFLNSPLGQMLLKIGTAFVANAMKTGKEFGGKAQEFGGAIFGGVKGFAQGTVEKVSQAMAIGREVGTQLRKNLDLMLPFLDNIQKGIFALVKETGNSVLNASGRPGFTRRHLPIYSSLPKHLGDNALTPSDFIKNKRSTGVRRQKISNIMMKNPHWSALEGTAEFEERLTKLTGLLSGLRGGAFGFTNTLAVGLQNPGVAMVTLLAQFEVLAVAIGVAAIALAFFANAYPESFKKGTNFLFHTVLPGLAELVKFFIVTIPAALQGFVKFIDMLGSAIKFVLIDIPGTAIATFLTISAVGMRIISGLLRVISTASKIAREVVNPLTHALWTLASTGDATEIGAIGYNVGDFIQASFKIAEEKVLLGLFAIRQAGHHFYFMHIKPLLDSIVNALISPFQLIYEAIAFFNLKTKTGISSSELTEALQKDLPVLNGVINTVKQGQESFNKTMAEGPAKMAQLKQATNNFSQTMAKVARVLLVVADAVVLLYGALTLLTGGLGGGVIATLGVAVLAALVFSGQLEKISGDLADFVDNVRFYVEAARDWIWKLVTSPLSLDGIFQSAANGVSQFFSGFVKVLPIIIVILTVFNSFFRTGLDIGEGFKRAVIDVVNVLVKVVKLMGQAVMLGAKLSFGGGQKANKAYNSFEGKNKRLELSTKIRSTKFMQKTKFGITEDEAQQNYAALNERKLAAQYRSRMQRYFVDVRSMMEQSLIAAAEDLRENPKNASLYSPDDLEVIRKGVKVEKRTGFGGRVGLTQTQLTDEGRAAVDQRMIEARRGNARSFDPVDDIFNPLKPKSGDGFVSNYALKTWAEVTGLNKDDGETANYSVSDLRKLGLGSDRVIDDFIAGKIQRIEIKADSVTVDADGKPAKTSFGTGTASAGSKSQAPINQGFPLLPSTYRYQRISRDDLVAMSGSSDDNSSGSSVFNDFGDKPLGSQAGEKAQNRLAQKLGIKHFKIDQVTTKHRIREMEQELLWASVLQKSGDLYSERLGTFMTAFQMMDAQNNFVFQPENLQPHMKMLGFSDGEIQDRFQKYNEALRANGSPGSSESRRNALGPHIIAPIMKKQLDILAAEEISRSKFDLPDGPTMNRNSLRALLEIDANQLSGLRARRPAEFQDVLKTFGVTAPADTMAKGGQDNQMEHVKREFREKQLAYAYMYWERFGEAVGPMAVSPLNSRSMIFTDPQVGRQGRTVTDPITGAQTTYSQGTTQQFSLAETEARIRRMQDELAAMGALERGQNSGLKAQLENEYTRYMEIKPGGPSLSERRNRLGFLQKTQAQKIHELKKADPVNYPNIHAIVPEGPQQSLIGSNLTDFLKQTGLIEREDTMSNFIDKYGDMTFHALRAGRYEEMNPAALQKILDYFEVSQEELYGGGRLTEERRIEMMRARRGTLENLGLASAKQTGDGSLKSLQGIQSAAGITSSQMGQILTNKVKDPEILSQVASVLNVTVDELQAELAKKIPISAKGDKKTIVDRLKNLIPTSFSALAYKDTLEEEMARIQEIEELANKTYLTRKQKMERLLSQAAVSMQTGSGKPSNENVLTAYLDGVKLTKAEYEKFLKNGAANLTPAATVLLDEFGESLGLDSGEIFKLETVKIQANWKVQLKEKLQTFQFGLQNFTDRFTKQVVEQAAPDKKYTEYVNMATQNAQKRAKAKGKSDGPIKSLLKRTGISQFVDEYRSMERNSLQSLMQRSGVSFEQMRTELMYLGVPEEEYVKLLKGQNKSLSKNTVEKLRTIFSKASDAFQESESQMVAIEKSALKTLGDSIAATKMNSKELMNEFRAVGATMEEVQSLMRGTGITDNAAMKLRMIAQKKNNSNFKPNDFIEAQRKAYENAKEQALEDFFRTDKFTIKPVKTFGAFMFQKLTEKGLKGLGKALLKGSQFLAVKFFDISYKGITVAARKSITFLVGSAYKNFAPGIFKGVGGAVDEGFNRVADVFGRAKLVVPDLLGPLNNAEAFMRRLGGRSNSFFNEQAVAAEASRSGPSILQRVRTFKTQVISLSEMTFAAYRDLFVTVYSKTKAAGDKTKSAIGALIGGIMGGISKIWQSMKKLASPAKKFVGDGMSTRQRKVPGLYESSDPNAGLKVDPRFGTSTTAKGQKIKDLGKTAKVVVNSAEEQQKRDRAIRKMDRYRAFKSYMQGVKRERGFEAATQKASGFMGGIGSKIQNLGHAVGDKFQKRSESRGLIPIRVPKPDKAPVYGYRQRIDDPKKMDRYIMRTQRVFATRLVKPLTSRIDSFVAKSVLKISGKFTNAFTKSAKKTSQAWRVSARNIQGNSWGSLIKRAAFTGWKLVQYLNHGASDVTSAAWRRTDGVFQDVTDHMVHQAKDAGHDIAKAMAPPAIGHHRDQGTEQPKKGRGESIVGAFRKVGRIGMAVGGAIGTISMFADGLGDSLHTLGLISEDQAEKMGGQMQKVSTVVMLASGAIEVLTATSEIFVAVFEFIPAVVGMVGGVFSGTMALMATAAQVAGGAIWTALTGPIGLAAAIIIPAAIAIVFILKKYFGIDLVAGIMVKVKALITKVQQSWNGLVRKFDGKLLGQSIGEGLKSSFAAAIAQIKSAWTGFANWFKELPLVKFAINIAKGLIAALNCYPTVRIPLAWESASHDILGSMMGLLHFAMKLGGSLVKVFSGAFSAIKSGSNLGSIFNDSFAAFSHAKTFMEAWKKDKADAATAKPKDNGQLDLFDTSQHKAPDPKKTFDQHLATAQTFITKYNTQMMRAKLGVKIFSQVGIINKEQSEGLNKLIDGMSNVGTHLNSAIGYATTFYGYFKGKTEIIQKVVGGFSKFKTAAIAAGTAVVEFLVSPFFLIPAAVIGSLLIANAAIKHFFGVDLLGKLWDSISASISKAAPKIVGAMKGAAVWIQGAWQGFVNWFTAMPLVKVALDIAQGLINALNHNPTVRIPLAWESARDWISDSIMSLPSVALDAAGQMITSLGDGAKSSAQEFAKHFDPRNLFGQKSTQPEVVAAPIVAEPEAPKGNRIQQFLDRFKGQKAVVDVAVPDVDAGGKVDQAAQAHKGRLAMLKEQLGGMGAMVGGALGGIKLPGVGKQEVELPKYDYMPELEGAFKAARAAGNDQAAQYIKLLAVANAGKLDVEQIKALETKKGVGGYMQAGVGAVNLKNHAKEQAKNPLSFAKGIVENVSAGAAEVKDLMGKTASDVTNEWNDRWDFLQRNGSGDILPLFQPGLNYMKDAWSELSTGAADFGSRAVKAMMKLDFKELGSAAKDFGGAMMRSLGNIANGFKSASLSAVVFGVWSLLGLNPVILVLGAIAVIALMVATNFLGIRDVLVGIGKVIGGIWEIFTSVVKGIIKIGNGLVDIFYGITYAIQGDFTMLGIGIHKVWDGVTDITTGFCNGVKSIFEGLGGILKGIFEAASQTLDFFLGDKLKFLDNMFDGGVKAAQDFGGFLVEAMNKPQEIFQTVADSIQNIINKIKGVGEAIENASPARMVKAVVNKVTGQTSTPVDGAVPTAKPTMRERFANRFGLKGKQAEGSSAEAAIAEAMALTPAATGGIPQEVLAPLLMAQMAAAGQLDDSAGTEAPKVISRERRSRILTPTQSAIVEPLSVAPEVVASPIPVQLPIVQPATQDLDALGAGAKANMQAIANNQVAVADRPQSNLGADLVGEMDERTKKMNETLGSAKGSLQSFASAFETLAPGIAGPLNGVLGMVDAFDALKSGIGDAKTVLLALFPGFAQLIGLTTAKTAAEVAGSQVSSAAAIGEAVTVTTANATMSASYAATAVAAGTTDAVIAEGAVVAGTTTAVQGGIIGGINTWLASTFTFLGGAAGTAWALITGPLLPIIAVIGLLVVAFFAVRHAIENNFMGIGTLFSQLGMTFKQLIGSIYQAFKPILNVVTMVGKVLLALLVVPIMLAVHAIILVVKAFSGIFNAVSWLTKGWLFVSFVLPLKLGMAVLGTIGKFFSWIGGGIAAIGGAIWKAFVAPFEFLKSLVSGLFNFILGTITKIPIIGPVIGAIASKLGVGKKQEGSDGSEGGIPKYAKGGLVTGPGTSTGDRVVAAISPREYIVNAADTSKNFSILEAINSGMDVESILQAMPVAGPKMVPPPAGSLTRSAPTASAQTPLEDGLTIKVEVNIQEVNVGGGQGGAEAAEEFLDSLEPQLERRMRDIMRRLVEFTR